MGRSVGRMRWLAVLVAAAAGVAASTRLDAPPRFDGAGYAVLARSLATGQGYRAIDHPDRPLHGHFPPGYPLALAGLWRLTGISVAAAHGFSAACTLAAIGLIGRWLVMRYPGRIAWLLALALACNWRWHRDGGAIQSEPLFNLWTALALLAEERARRGEDRWFVGVMPGLLLAAACLTRHVGIGLAIACLADLAWCRRFRCAGVAAVVLGALLVPWGIWLARLGQGTQLGLIPDRGIVSLVLAQGLFYLRRLPDQIVGPVVEIATVFRPTLAGPGTLAAALGTLVIVAGWVRDTRSRRRRPAALVPLATVPILLVWPFTEAGRFLVPLVPFVLTGAWGGLAMLGGRRWAAAALVAVSLPYSVYAAITDRAGAQQQQHADFDAACRWLAQPGRRPGPVLSRHPGEVFWQTNRQALGVGENDAPEEIRGQIARYRVVYLLIDEERYARAPTNPLQRYADARPADAALVWRGEGTRIYEVVKGP